MENKERKKMAHNYLFLVVIFLLSIFFVIYLCRWYKVYDEYQKETPVIRGSLLEIVPDDLEHYVMENPTIAIYMCTSSDDNCRSFEKDFKKLLKHKDYTNEIVYLNLSEIDNDEFVNNFNDKYYYKNKLKPYYPALVLFVDGRVNNILQGDVNSNLSISRVRQFLELNDIGE